jgi:hypothetical protein
VVLAWDVSELAAEVVDVEVVDERVSEDLTDDGQEVAQGADRVEGSEGGVTVVAAAGGEENGCLDDFERDAISVELAGEGAVIAAGSEGLLGQRRPPGVKDTADVVAGGAVVDVGTWLALIEEVDGQIVVTFHRGSR